MPAAPAKELNGAKAEAGHPVSEHPSDAKPAGDEPASAKPAAPPYVITPPHAPLPEKDDGLGYPYHLRGNG